MRESDTKKIIDNDMLLFEIPCTCTAQTFKTTNHFNGIRNDVKFDNK